MVPSPWSVSTRTQDHGTPDGPRTKHEGLRTRRDRELKTALAIGGREQASLRVEHKRFRVASPGDQHLQLAPRLLGAEVQLETVEDIVHRQAVTLRRVQALD